jgi:hypothetical protein
MNFIFLSNHPSYLRIYFPGKKIHPKKIFLGNNENFFSTIPYFLQNNFLAFTLLEVGVSRFQMRPMNSRKY